MATRIFLSYGRPDREQVEDIYTKLKASGYDPWMDSKSLHGGEKWRQAIDNAITECDFFLACLSTQTVARRGVLQHELKLALSRWEEKMDSDIFFIHVRLDECELPKNLSQFQWIDLWRDNAWSQIHEAIKAGNAALTSPRPTSLGITTETPTTLTHAEIDYMLRLNAETISLRRRYASGYPTRPSTEEEMLHDWNMAILSFVDDILRGDIEFVTRIPPSSYYHFQSVWLREMKRFLAYLSWEARGTRVFESDTLDYDTASEELRHTLMKEALKTKRDGFPQVQSFLEAQYLTDGHFDELKPASRILLKRKAQRIWQSTRDPDVSSHYFLANTYAAQFYGNIVQAVVSDDAKTVSNVLRAFAFSDSPEHRYDVIDCFEYLLVCHYFTADRLRDYVEANGFPI